MRLVGALGRDQTYVSAGNPTHRKGNGGQKGTVGRDQCLMRELEMGEIRCGFRRSLEETSVGGVGVEVSGTAPKGQGKTQRDLILEAVEGLGLRWWTSLSV